jgi:hypothetical protein
MFAVQGLSLTLVLSWQTPIMAVALVLVALSWRRLSTMERLLGTGILLSFGFFLFFPSPQGHGWGYRYTYAVLGSMSLLGAIGIDQIQHALGTRATRLALIGSTAVTLFVQLPLRGVQIERYVRPFADANEYIRTMDADVVIVDPTVSWYGIDLVRNDPFLQNRPKVISAFGFRPELRQSLAAQSGVRVHMLGADELAKFGLPIFPSRFKRPIWPPS